MLLCACMVAGDRTALQAVLKHASPGRQQPLWDALPKLAARVLFIAGAEDIKFAALAHRMAAVINNSGDNPLDRPHGLEGPAADESSSSQHINGAGHSAADDARAAAVEVAGCGHAVHLERPEALALLLHQFLQVD